MPKEHGCVCLCVCVCNYICTCWHTHIQNVYIYEFKIKWAFSPPLSPFVVRTLSQTHAKRTSLQKEESSRNTPFSGIPLSPVCTRVYVCVCVCVNTDIRQQIPSTIMIMQFRVGACLFKPRPFEWGMEWEGPTNHPLWHLSFFLRVLKPQLGYF